MTGKYICENGHIFDEPDLLWDSTDLVKCCPVEGCTAEEDWEKYSEKINENQNPR